MRSISFPTLLLALGTAACSTQPNSSLKGAWASDQVSLTVTDSGANLQLLASGGCFGSYGQIPEGIPEGHFSTTGTFSQLIGAYPGKVDYPAQYSGQVDGTDLVLTITVPAVPLTIGPVHLTAGRTQHWSACQYP